MPNDMSSPDLDIDQASTDLASDLTGTMDLSPDTSLDTAVDTAADDTPAARADGRDEHGRFAPKETPQDTPAAGPDGTVAAAAPIDDLPVPKSWGKETHDLWAKAARGEPLTKEESRTLLTTFNTRESQMAEGAKAYATDAEYGRSMRSVISKHDDVIRSQGLDPGKAVDYLFNAHRQLSTGTPEQKMAYLGKVAETYGLKLPSAAPADPNAPPPVELPAEVKAALARIERVEGALTEQQRRDFAAEQERVGGEVNAFASDPKNAYFDEVSADLIHLIAAEQQAGRQPVLATLYEKAVWANPVTRQKELARIQQETDVANRKKAQEAAAAARKSTSTNVKGRDTQRAPQAPAASLNNLDDVMRETHEEIRSRA